jgi:hypothetical protein
MKCLSEGENYISVEVFIYFYFLDFDICDFFGCFGNCFEVEAIGIDNGD